MADAATDPRDNLNETGEELRANINRVNSRKRPYWRIKARETYKRIIGENLYGAGEPPPLGHLRASDVMPEQKIYYNLTRGINWFASNHGFEPDLFAPKRFTEKMLVAKFFAPVPMPSPGDKLAVGRYIPDAFKSVVKPAKCVWSSPFPTVPADIDAPPGVYYFKANHGSGYNAKITLPLTEERQAELSAAAKKWLSVEYGARGGEWWYLPMQRRVFIEESFSKPGESATDWKIFTLNGRVSIIQVDLDRARNHVQLIYDRDFNFLKEEFFYRSGEPIERPENFDEMIAAAEAIGSHFEFARVDFYNTANGIVLGEITLAPGGARQRVRSPSLDDRMGREWVSDMFPATA